MHMNGFVRGKGKFIITEYVATDERTGPRFPLLLTTGRILSQYNVGAQTRRTANVVWHEEDRLEIHPARCRTARRSRRRLGEACEPCRARPRLRALITERVAPGVVYTTFHHPETQANVITTDYSDWATNCPEYKVTAVQVTPSNGPTEWQEQYDDLARNSRRIAPWSKPRSSAYGPRRHRVARTAWRTTVSPTGDRADPGRDGGRVHLQWQLPMR